jgi:polar amino acid transport system substrate-binding protein
MVDTDAGRVLIVVRDTGFGIQPEDMPHITDPFFTTKRSVGGTGLGLPVSAKIVQEHGGTLDFSTKPGSGTTATLSLPMIREEVRP